MINTDGLQLGELMRKPFLKISPWISDEKSNAPCILDLVRKVQLFDQMDGRMLDAICERLKPCLCTPSTCLVREGDPVNEMLFIVRGHLDSCTTNGGRIGFFNSCSIGAGDFCGEELLTWALDPRPNVVLPSSTRTVKAITEFEAFALIAEDSYAAKLAASTRRGGSKRCGTQFDILNSLQKPVEPDFTVEDR